MCLLLPDDLQKIVEVNSRDLRCKRHYNGARFTMQVFSAGSIVLSSFSSQQTLVRK